jgi:uncharacterized protein (TIGR04222 family)
MNPFDWTGPQFLVFYLALALIVHLSLRTHVRFAEMSGDVSLSDLSADPYQIAYLRQGRTETIQLAVLSLIDRNLLRATGEDRLKTNDAGAVEIPRRPLEKLILQFCLRERAAGEVTAHSSIQAAADAYGPQLEKRRLMPDVAQRSSRRRAVAIAALVLLGAAAFKIALALSRGRTNIGILIVLGLVALAFLLPVLTKRMTALGVDTLTRLKTLFARLNRNATSIRPGGLTNEAQLLGAIFGLSALPSLAFPHVDRLYRRQRSASDSGGCGGSGSSGCGGSGGGGCGGCGGGD